MLFATISTCTVPWKGREDHQFDRYCEGTVNQDLSNYGDIILWLTSYELVHSNYISQP